MNILSFFYPQVLETAESPISGGIKVIEQFGRRRLEIGKITQSGGIVERIWKKALRKFPISNFQFLNCLILGLGSGTVAKILVSSPKPQASSLKITGVEIDPEVIRLGKKYFGLGDIKNLQIVIGDAAGYISKPFNYLTMKPFNLILVDLYQGREIPKSCQTKDFLAKLKKLKQQGGLVIFNRLYSKDEKQITEEFVRKCRRVFKRVKTSKAVCNLMVWCR